MTVSSQDTQRADNAAKKNQAQITKLTKDQAAAQAKIVKDKRLQAAIDKAQAALGKSSDVFDIDQIQVAAALTNQAEQLAKATTGAQALQIANDTARLNVKRSMLALEDAIAAKDEQAIIKATEKLNADLKILGALSGQELKLKEIKSILDGLASKTIGINVDTADALKKIKALYDSAAAGILIPISVSSTTSSVGSGASGVGLGNNGTGQQVPVAANFNITVNTGIGDPNAIADEIAKFLNDAAARGTLTNGILTIK
jgi:hypothetical protein